MAFSLSSSSLTGIIRVSSIYDSSDVHRTRVPASYYFQMQIIIKYPFNHAQLITAQELYLLLLRFQWSRFCNLLIVQLETLISSRHFALRLCFFPPVTLISSFIYLHVPLLQPSHFSHTQCWIIILKEFNNQFIVWTNSSPDEVVFPVNQPAARAL